MSSLKDLMRLDGRVAVVTGGAGHIGSMAAETLVEMGARVALLDISGDALASACGKLKEASGAKALGICLDLSDPDAVRTVPERVMSEWGRLDIIVNSAALVGASDLKGWVTPFAEQSPEAWDKAMAVNLRGPFFLIQACAPALAASGHGSVVNISSIYGIVGPDMRIYSGTGLGNPGAYAASKGGLIQITRWLATTLAPGIRVNAVSPGGVRRSQPEAFVKAYCERTPMRRMATEDDLRGAIAYLASDMSAYVTGQNLVVDGGWSVW